MESCYKVVQPALVEDLEGVGARGAGLEPVGVVGHGCRGDGDVRPGLAGGEDERAALLRVVLPGEGRERDGAVVHRLGGACVAVARDGEVVAAAADGEGRRLRGQRRARGNDDGKNSKRAAYFRGHVGPRLKTMLSHVVHVVFNDSSARRGSSA